jgi:hypothetical protein
MALMSNQIPRDRPAEDEMEVTPEIIAAVEDVLLQALGGGVSVNWWPRDLAVSVYRAMALRVTS